MSWLCHLAVLFAFLAALARPARASAFTPANSGTRGEVSSLHNLVRHIDPDGRIDQGLFGVGTLRFEYDSCRTGTLCMVAFPSDVLGISYQYDAEGNATRETRRFNLAGVTGSRSMETVYGPGGRVREHTYADANGTAGTRSSIQYDDRALPSHLWWIPPSGTQRLGARQRRNLAGLVTTREAAPTDPAVVDVSSAFAYDRLSRVQSQTVTSRTGGQLAKQALDYFGHDDPRRLQHWLGAHYYNFDLSYDARHQLASVKEASNQFASSYQFTLGAKLARVTVAAQPAPGSDVIDRDVTYQYASPIDPEAVSALAPAAGGPNLRAYTYDSAGNLVTRDGGSASEAFVYDGEDQLRRARVGASAEEYFYDHDGHRMAVVTRAGGTVEEVRVFFGDTELVFGPTSVLKQSLAHLSLGTPVARITDRTQLELQYHGLSNNTLVSVTPDGAVQSGFVYSPYGEVLRSLGTAATSQRRRFNDKFRDRLTSLTYYGVRYYDGLSLTWTQADSLFRFAPDAAWDDPRRGNLYQFSLSNPIRYIDPDGRNPLGSGGWNHEAIGDAAARGEGHIRCSDCNILRDVPMMKAALIGLVAMVSPKAAFMLFMSQARDHSDTVLPIIALGVASGARATATAAKETPIVGRALSQAELGAPKVLMGKQGKHIPRHNNFEPGRSVLRADPESLAARAGTGEQVGKVPVGQPGSKERVVFDDIIGDYVDEAGAAAQTRVGIIHYSKGGIHIIPGRPQ